MTSCLTPAEVFALSSNSGDIAERHREHVAACDVCGRRVRAVSVVLASDEVAAMAAVCDERPRALVAELTGAPEHRWSSMIGAEARYQGPEIARELLALAAYEFDRSPIRAERLLHAATVVAQRIPRSARAERLAAEAWREWALALARVDRLSDALLALDMAADFAEDTDTPAVDAGIVAHARAFIATEYCGRHGDALALIDVALLQIGRDPERSQRLHSLRAAVLVRLGRSSEAAAILETMLPDGGAVTHHMLAFCYWNDGRPDLALQHTDDALAVFAQDHNTVRAIKSLVVKGNALSDLGRHDEALRLLRAATTMFAQAGMRDSEVRAELFTVRAELAADVHLSDVEVRVRRAYELAVALHAAEPIGSNDAVREASAYLEACARAGALTVETARYVARYVAAIEVGRVTIFTPPHSAILM